MTGHRGAGGGGGSHGGQSKRWGGGGGEVRGSETVSIVLSTRRGGVGGGRERGELRGQSAGGWMKVTPQLNDLCVCVLDVFSSRCWRGRQGK